MTKQELVHIAKVMYVIQKQCEKKYFCDGCPAYTGKICKIKEKGDGVPANWHITSADIERLERESND